jgi:hypothetical protein
MTVELFEALESLCDMWGQYCGGEYGHSFMSAGEGAMDVLEKYGLLKNATVCAGDIDWDKLEELRKQIV